MGAPLNPDVDMFVQSGVTLRRTRAGVTGQEVGSQLQLNGGAEQLLSIIR